jgi:hypothetical protein
MNEPVLHSNRSVFHCNRLVDVWILVDGPCERAVHDGDALAHTRNRAVRAGKPSETRVNALFAIGIVPYSPDPGRRGRADVLYARENDRYSRIMSRTARTTTCARWTTGVPRAQREWRVGVPVE